MSSSPPTQQFVSASARVQGAVHVLLMTTGSVASIKAPLIAAALLEHPNVQLQVVATEPSLTFFDPAEVEASGTAKGKAFRVWRDRDEWQSWKKIGDPILHIELRRWADVVLIAPCSANTLAKIAGGLCDNLATSLLRALDPSTPTFLFPAMNTHMYAHPLTAKHLDVVAREIGYRVVGPVGKGLACGDVGVGAMTEWRDIVKLVEDEFVKPAEVGPAEGEAPAQESEPKTPQQAMASLSLLSPSSAATRSPAPDGAVQPIPVRLKSRWDTLISLSTPSTTPPPTPPPTSPSPAPGALPFDRDARHPMTLSRPAIDGLVAARVLPPTLVHSEHVRPERRLFWFVPSRLEARQLEGLARACAADTEGGGRRGEWADEIVTGREWLERCYGEDR